jgi:hypothetical protein
LEGIKMNEHILGQLEQLLKEEVKNLSGDFEQIEQLVMQKMLSLGKGILQRLVERGRNGYKGSSLPCRCGSSARFVGHRGRDIHSLFGWIRIRRAYYHCPDCGSGLAPYDKASGLGCEQVSPGLAKACCMLAVDDSFKQTSQKIENIYGQKVSPNTIERLAQQVGTVVLQQADKQLSDFEEHRQIPQGQLSPDRLYIAADGTTVHEIDGWHEAKMGVVYYNDEHQDRKSCYVGCFDNSARFGWRLWLQACRCGLRDAQEVVFLGDGAGWVRSEHYRHFGRATFIIDWYHASEHIWDCGKVLFGQGTEATKNWSEQREGWLWDGQTRKLLNDLQEQYKRHRGSKRDELGSLHKYIKDNEQQMRYDVFRAKGYDIGSGAAEGACKYVIGKRLKQSGMIWKRSGSSAILALRIVWLNNRWQQFWENKPLAA